MTRPREIFQTESTQSLKSKENGGFFISKNQACLLFLFCVIALAVSACLTYFITAKSLKSENIPENDLNSLNVSKGEQPDKLPHKGETKKSHEDVRLPRSVVPYFYEIRLVPFLYENNFTFNGEVKILVNVTSDTDNVTLHVYDLEIDGEDSVKVTEIGGKSIQIHHLSNDTNKQFFILHTKEVIKKGHQYKIEIKYTGYLNDELQGFYRSQYAVGNETRWLATTQFEATQARRAFPCFDEPALKSKFKLFIGRPVNMTSISNMPQQASGNSVPGLPDYVWDEYQTSVPMSTYLVAFVVSDFDHITNGENFTVWARKSAINQAKYSLDIGPKILKYFENYFGIDFPLPKLDMVAVPDFASGAMENWGLITFRETALLFEEAVSSINSKERIANVISHELAHQWFGNLVTPSWWTDLWLNEGFASYVEYLGVEAVEPSWKVMDRFVISETQKVFALDALLTSHQISITVRNPDEISEIFDTISYGKGASIIRMMDNFLTTEVFRRGLTKYLKRHKYANSEQDDLWTALTEQGQQDGLLTKDMSVKTIMDTWTLQTGFPVITVLRDYNRRNAIITQKRFLLSKPESESLDHSNESFLWWVPITYTTSEDRNFQTTFPSHWMKQEEKITINGLPSSNSWVIFNIQQTGFYRVNYDSKNWELLAEYLNNPSLFLNIHPINRAQIVDDAMNLARAELLSYDVALNVTSYLVHELEYVPWNSALDAFSYLSNMLIQTGGYEKFKIYLLRIINKLYNQVGFESHPHDSLITIYKRRMAVRYACFLEHPDCIENSVKRFANWKARNDPDNDNPIPPDLKSIIYCTAIKNGDESDWNFAWMRFKNSNVATEKHLLLNALGCSREVWILRRALDWSFTENSGIRKQDAEQLFSSIARNSIGQIVAFNFLLEQWDRIKNYVGNVSFTISGIIESSTSRIISKSQLKQLIEFAKEHRNELGSANRAVDQAIEQAKANIRWKEKNYDTIIRWLDLKFCYMSRLIPLWSPNVRNISLNFQPVSEVYTKEKGHVRDNRIKEIIMKMTIQRVWNG